MRNLQYAVRDNLAYITLNRPAKKNALNHDLVTDLKLAFKNAEEDDTVKVVILNASGDVFCAGADLEYLQQLQGFSFGQNLADSTHLKELFLQIYQLKKIVIAEIQGTALAGGCGLATVCDFAFSVPEARFGYSEVKIGFIPAIVMVFLIRKVGEGLAKQLLLTGSSISAQEARNIHLINGVITKSKIHGEVSKFATQLIQSNSSYAMSMTKQMISKVQSLPLEDALTWASEMNAKARESEDCRKGIAAFLSKQKIRW